MSKVWEFNGFTIDEGLKPTDGNYKSDSYQYFFLVKKGDSRVMKYCVWAPKEIIDELKGGGPGGETHFDPARLVREKGIDRVKERIRTEDFADTLLKISHSGAKEIPLSELSKKLT